MRLWWNCVRAFAVVAATTASLPFCISAHAQSRVALVIGNAAYIHTSALPNPVNDASDVAGSLERLGFAVRRINNGTFDAMRRAMLEFGQRARGAEMAVVFFAGHGMEVGGENWLIPTDAELKNDIDAEHEAISLRSIIAVASTAAKLGLVILDSCRNNPFAAKMRRLVHTRAQVSRGLVRVEPTGSVLVAYAARDGTTAADGTKRNSPYTAALLRHLETPGLEINFLFRNVRDDVMTATKREQEPFVYGSLGRQEIYLKAALPVPAGPLADEISWTLVQDSTDINQLRRFIERFPDSPRRPDAERRITALEREAAKAKEAERTTDPRELARLLQLELSRVGCFSGSVDGNFDATTRAALRNFARLAAVNVPDSDPTVDAVNAVRGFNTRVCPLVCQPNERAEGERCLRIVCPAGQVVKDGQCVAQPGTAAKPAAPKGKCFTFQGRQFCE